MADTRIEWCTKTWPIVEGCTPVSSGCKNCWGPRVIDRLAGNQRLHEKYAELVHVNDSGEVEDSRPSRRLQEPRHSRRVSDE